MLFKNLLLEQLDLRSCVAAPGPSFSRSLRSLEKLERSLLGLVAGLDQVLQRLLALSMLLLAYDASALRLHQIRLDEATGGMLRRSVVNLSLRSNRGDLGRLACLSHF